MRRNIVLAPVNARGIYKEKGLRRVAEPNLVRFRDALLGGAQIDRLRAAPIRLDIEGDGLTVAQRVHAGRLNSGNVNEHVLFAVIRRNEAEALGRVEKFNGTFGHSR